jgi:hypothetical protein
VVVTGSFYVVGAARTYMSELAPQLFSKHDWVWDEDPPEEGPAWLWLLGPIPKVVHRLTGFDVARLWHTKQAA